MTRSAALAQIVSAIEQLSHEERLWLLERLAHGLRQGAPAQDTPPALAAALAMMAADPEMRRELAQIAQEFAPAELDGLEPS